MKFGFKHKTALFGTDAEYFVSNLFQMIRNRNGSNRPDLIWDYHGRGTPLSIELKSGKGKGVMILDQLKYSLNTEEDYAELLGEKPPPRRELGGLFSNLESKSLPFFLRNNPVAYYYGVLNRTCGTRAENLDRPFSAIKLKWGDLMIVPHDYGFYNYAVRWHLREGIPMKRVIKILKDFLKGVVENNGCQGYEEIRSKTSSWQDLQSSDILSVFHNDLYYARRGEGEKRLKLMRKHYPRFDQLVPVLIKGVCGKNIYILALPEDKNIFDKKLRRIVGSRRKTLEKITREREDALHLLDRIKKQRISGLFGMEEGDEEIVSDLSEAESNLLKRLTKWLAEGEITVEERVMNRLLKNVPF